MSSKELTRGAIMKMLDYGYEKAIGGIPGFDSASQMADNYMGNGKSNLYNAKRLIRWQVSKAGTSGFVTGLGGVLTMPVTVPANIASVIYVQIRMIAAIAHMGGYDLKDDRVKSLVYICLVGNGAKDLLKDVGIVLGKKLATQMILNISKETISAINRKVGFKLLSKFGEKSVITLGKTVPVVGGVVSATFDSLATAVIGKVATKTFIDRKMLMTKVE